MDSKKVFLSIALFVLGLTSLAACQSEPETLDLPRDETQSYCNSCDLMADVASNSSQGRGKVLTPIDEGEQDAAYPADYPAYPFEEIEEVYPYPTDETGDIPYPTSEELIELYPAPITDDLSDQKTQASVPSTEQIQPTETVDARNVDPDLRATDPGLFKLIAGKVQLVEFFAFW